MYCAVLDFYLALTAGVLVGFIAEFHAKIYQFFSLYQVLQMLWIKASALQTRMRKVFYLFVNVSIPVLAGHIPFYNIWLLIP